MNMASEIFNPLDKYNLAKSIANEIFSRPAIPLLNLQQFFGAGIYALYYKGNFPLYANIAKSNEKEFSSPIYAGKAVPEGARKGGMGLETPSGTFLFRRLMEHKKPIEAAKNLDIADFYCRYLIVDDIWIPLGESLLIEISRPLWNYALDGFGNHDPGKGRYNQQKSSWDTLHPGREWAEKLQTGKSLAEVQSIVKKFLSK